MSSFFFEEKSADDNKSMKIYPACIGLNGYDFLFRQDTTETGHILGPAAARGEGHVQERALSSVHCSCLRLLTHMSMYLGAANDPQVMTVII